MTEPGPATRDALVAERDFLLRSIEDLEREHQAGDLEGAGYASLRADYVARAAAAIRALEQLDPSSAPEAARTASAWRRLRRYLGRRRVRRVVSAVLACCVLGVATLTALHLAGVRLPGQSASGSVTLSEQAAIYQQLEEASAEAEEGQVADAVLLYDAVLAKQPDQPVALTARGWLVRLSGLSTADAAAVREGDADLARAARVAPGYAQAEGYDAFALEVDARDASAAVAHFARMLADRPSEGLVAAVSSAAREAYLAAHRRVPAAFASR